MARHVWQTKVFQAPTLSTFRAALARAAAGGMTAERALTFAGYYVETVRQTGMKPDYELGKNCKPRFVYQNALPRFLDRCHRSGHKYARGRNAARYLDAGRRMLSAVGTLGYGFKEDVEWQYVWDYLKERGEL